LARKGLARKDLARKKDADFRTVPREHDPEKWVPVFGKDHAPAI